MTDVADSYIKKQKLRTEQQAVAEMDDFVNSIAKPAGPGGFTPIDPTAASSRPTNNAITVPGKYESRRSTDDALGRLSPDKSKKSMAGKIVDNVSEVVPSAVKGPINFVMTAVDPLADLLDEKVYNFSEKFGTMKINQPETPTGRVVESVSRFMTGFIPAARGLKAMGVSGGVANPMMAGAISDFAGRDGHEARLADLWVAAGMPENDFANWLKVDKDDSQFEGRLKGALEGVGAGIVGSTVINGLISSVKAARAVIAQGRKIVDGDAEIAALKEKYGELTDQDVVKYFGDTKLPVVETRPKAVAAAGKIGAAPNLDPRAVIRTTKKTPAAPLAGHKKTDLGDVVVTESAKEPGKFQVTYWDGEAGKSNPTKDAIFDTREEAIASFEKAGSGKVMEQSWGDKLFHAGEYSGGDVAPGTFMNADKEAVEQFAKHAGSTRVTELSVSPKNTATEVDVVAEAKRLGVYIDNVPVGQYLEKDVYAESGEIIKSLRKKGFDSVELKDGISQKSPSLVVLDPKIVNQADNAIKSEDFETYINFARIDEPEQVKFTIGKMAEAMKGQVDEARRGKITQDETKKMADDLGMTVDDLLERRKGQPFNAEEALAARQLWAASGENLLKLAKAASGPNAGDLDQFAFRRAMAVHSAIQSEVIGARTETARALAAWKIPAGGGVEKARAIEQIMGGGGGAGFSKEMARRLTILAENGDPKFLAKFAERGWGATTLDAVKEIWVNGLLSSPKTHVVNVTSNTGVALQQVYERAVAGGIRGLIGGDGVKAAESIAMLYGMKSAIRDAFRMAAVSLKTGETGAALGKVDLPYPDSFSAEAFRMSSETGAGKFVDFLGHVARVPGRLLGAEDEFFKTIGYRMELHAQAFRKASTEGLPGAKLDARMKELIDNPPEHIRIEAADAALYNTFTNEVGWFGKAIMNLRDSGGSVGQMGMTLVVPFVRTPTNIARYTFERTPLAPLVGQWRADIAAGGARADLALARMSTGTAIMMTAMDYANDGTISGAGPTDNTEREALLRSGWQPYSVKVGDKWYSYNRADPFGATMGLAASISEAVNRGEIDQEDVDEWQEVTAMSIAAVGQVAINKTYLEGVSNAVQVMSDPKRYGESYVNNLFASFTPFTSLSSAVKNIGDPIQREANSPWEAVEARVLGLSKDLPPRRDLWGEPIKNESGMGKVYDFMSPVAVKTENIDPIDREIVRLGGGPQRIKKRSVFDGVSISMKQHPDVYDEYVRLAGNGLKHPAWNMGAKDYLNAVVSGKHEMSAVWDMMPDEQRRGFIESTIKDYRKLAQQQILNDPKFKKFRESVDYVKAAQQESKMPVFGE